MTSQQPAKAELRSATMAKRAEDHGKGYDAAAVTRLLEWIGPIKGAVIAGYMPIRTEISPLSAMSALSQDNTYACLWCRGRACRWCFTAGRRRPK